ncbi:PP2C family protein-serine/threonine phosphatase [Streptomyces sp. NPDC003077]|uniref:PP2C family protein-serine/threonine phosphatase n=1 Tax=Streptomyces sp. NPDC003077 TaxID=3154443 RepID=UPI0033AC354E
MPDHRVPTPVRRVLESRRAFPMLLIAVVVGATAVDASAGPGLHIAMFTGIVPMIAALWCSYRWTVAVAGVYLVCLLFVQVFTVPLWSTASKAVGIFSAVLVSVFAVALCRVRGERERLLARTSMVADVVQRAMMRELPLTVGGVRVAGFYVSAQEGARIGGDIYEAVRTPYGLRFMIGDVQGKGMPAIGAGHEVLASFREAAHHKPSLEMIAQRMEEALARYNTQSAERGIQERFVTALLLETPAPGRARALSCGHIPYYLVRGDEVVECHDGEGGLPLGLGVLTGEPRRGAPADCEADDWLVLCTDGVTEARGRDGEFYPLRDRLTGWTHLGPADLARALEADLTRFTGGRLKDDATLLVVRRLPLRQEPFPEPGWEARTDREAVPVPVSELAGPSAPEPGSAEEPPLPPR